MNATDADLQRVDDRIDKIKARMKATDDLILKLMKRNERRRDSLRKLGQHRAELLTEEFKLF